jgi:predicted MPP superfamily phosphohydrolase
LPVFWTFVTIMSFLLPAYVFWRAGSAAVVNRFVPGWVTLLAILLMYALLFFGRFGFRFEGSGWWPRVLQLVLMNGMGFVFITFFLMLAADLFTGFGFLLPKIAPIARAAALGTGLLLALIATVQGSRPPVIRDIEITLDKLPAELDGTVAVMVSDTHFGTLIGESWAEMLAGKVLALEPDIVLLVGDIFDGRRIDKEAVLPVLARIKAPLGTWAVMGNHDSFRRGMDEYYGEAGFTLLRNEWREVAPGLVVAGVDDLHEGEGNATERLEAVTKALDGRPEGATIYLSHRPIQAELAGSLGADLIFSGHTHGGQLWPFGYFVKNHYPLFAGSYKIGKMTLIVGRGAGTWGPRMRLWHPGEILRIVLRSA